MGRKYRQRGYMEDEAPERSRRLRPRERSEKPRGRGLGAPTATVFRCNACGRRLTLQQEVPSDATCEHCGSDLHTCTHCVHFDTSARWECLEADSIPDPVRAKARANRCPVFAPRALAESERDSDGPEDPRAAFEALFNL